MRYNAMKTNLKIILPAILFGCLGVSTSAISASFDCNFAQTDVEKILCNNPLISRLDHELSIEYRQILKKTDDEGRDKIKSEQRYWLKSIRNSCKTEKCVLRAYSRRLSDFMSTACQSNDKKMGAIREEVSKLDDTLSQEVIKRACTYLNYVTDDRAIDELITTFNEQLTRSGWNVRVTSCERVLEVNQVNLSGPGRTYSSYSAICNLGNGSPLVCDFPIVGKFSLTTSYTSSTIEMAKFALNNCPLGG